MSFKGAHTRRTCNSPKETEGSWFSLVQLLSSHDVSHPSFLVFTTLPQSHIPHPGPALLWLCLKGVSAVPQGPNQTHCLHHAPEGVVTDPPAFLASPLPAACRKRAPSTLTQEPQGMLAICELPQRSYTCTTKVGDGQLCQGAHLILIVLKQKTECRHIPAAARFADGPSFWHLWLLLR